MNSRVQIIEAGRFIAEKALTWGSSGNISVRDGDRVYITASGTVIGSLQPEDIIICDLSGTILDGSKKPSKETGMHLQIYKRRPEIRAIIHASPFYSTFCGCSRISLEANLFIESMYYDENILSVPYYHAGSAELAQAVGAACKDTHVILMKNHGVLVYDTDIKECRAALEVTENLCKMNVLARMGNIPLKTVPEEQVRDFLEGGYYKKRRN